MKRRRCESDILTSVEESAEGAIPCPLTDLEKAAYTQEKQSSKNS